MVDQGRRLGKGLDSLISSARDRSLSVDIIRKTGHRIQAVPTESIDPNPFQPRREFRIEELNDLVESLRLHGLMQPIVVRRNGERFQLIAGERRWRASRELGWQTIDAVVVEADDRRMLEWALIENIQRENLGPLELAVAYRDLMLRYDLTQDEVAKNLGKSRPNVANHLRLLDLPDSIKDRVSRGTVSMGAARAILALKDVELQEKIAAQVEAGELNVREIEELARSTSDAGVAAGSTGVRTPPPADPNFEAIREELQSLFATKVVLKGSLRRGRVIVHFSSAAQLDGLISQWRKGTGEERTEGTQDEAPLTV